MANLLETAAEVGSFDTLIKAIQAAELTEILTSPGPFTILAPTDEAFSKLPQGTIEALLQDTHKLKQILLYHVLFGDVRSDDLAEIEEAPTVEGTDIMVDHADGITVDEAHVTKMDILTDNGVIHVIDSVLRPTILADTVHH